MPFTFTPEMALGITQIYLAIKNDIQARRQSAGDNTSVTDADVLAELQQNVQRGLDEGADWKRDHPNA